MIDLVALAVIAIGAILTTRVLFKRKDYYLRAELARYKLFLQRKAADGHLVDDDTHNDFESDILDEVYKLYDPEIIRLYEKSIDIED